LLAVEIVLTCLTRPSERPGHATITDAIRSKPVAPLLKQLLQQGFPRLNLLL